MQKCREIIAYCDSPLLAAWKIGDLLRLTGCELRLRRLSEGERNREKDYERGLKDALKMLEEELQ